MDGSKQGATVNRTAKPAPAPGPSRVSQNAPESKSASANVWRMLEADDRFVQGMNEAVEQNLAGKFGPFRHARKRPG